MIRITLSLGSVSCAVNKIGGKAAQHLETWGGGVCASSTCQNRSAYSMHTFTKRSSSKAAATGVREKKKFHDIGQHGNSGPIFDTGAPSFGLSLPNT